QQPSLVAQVPHRVVGELLERLRDAPALLRQRRDELALAELASGGKAGAVSEDTPAANGHELALAELVEEVDALDVDQLHASSNEQQRPRVRKASGLRRRAVDDHSRSRIDQLLGGDSVEVAMVDDGDVPRPQPPREVLRPAVESCRAG